MGVEFHVWKRRHSLSYVSKPAQPPSFLIYLDDAVITCATFYGHTGRRVGGVGGDGKIQVAPSLGAELLPVLDLIDSIECRMPFETQVTRVAHTGDRHKSIW